MTSALIYLSDIDFRGDHAHKRVNVKIAQIDLYGHFQMLIGKSLQTIIKSRVGIFFPVQSTPNACAQLESQRGS